MVHMRHTPASRSMSPVRGLGRFAIAMAGIAVAATLTACSASSMGSGAGAPAGGRNDAAPGAPYAGAPAPSAAPGFNGDTSARRSPQSTFAIDVDTASYTYSRRQILAGGRPDPSTVRPEEFVNAFRQDYPQPYGNGFTVAIDGARLPDGVEESDTRLLRIGLQTRDAETTNRPDVALTFVVDVSGSMGEPGRLDLVQYALHTLIDQLRDTDSVAIVAYQTRARVLRAMTPARNRSALHNAIDQLRAGGSTNLEEGVVTGYRVARDGFVPSASNRVVLLSDGLANVGDTTADPILEQIRESAEKQITLLGVGVGSQYGDALMEQLADQGDGFVVYLSDRNQARDLFASRLTTSLTLRALDAKVQVTFNPSTVDSYRLVGYEDRALAPSQFRNDSVDGGEVGPGHSVTAIYVVRLHPGAEGPVAEARVRWLDPADHEAAEAAQSIDVSSLDLGLDGASPRLKVDYAAAFLAEVLRHGPDADRVRLADLATLASDAFAATDDPQVGELADLIRRVG